MPANVMATAHPTLRRLSAAAALAAAGGISYRAYRQGLLRSEDPSLDAWRAFETHVHAGADRLVAAAVLAASPHSSQPWRFTVRPGEILVHADFERALGAMDSSSARCSSGSAARWKTWRSLHPGRGLHP